MSANTNDVSQPAQKPLPVPDRDTLPPSGSASDIFHSLLDKLSGDDRQWVREVLVRQERQNQEADDENRPRSEPVW